MTQKEKYYVWLSEGAGWMGGVSLFKRFFGANHPFLLLIKKSGSQVKFEVLKQALKLFVDALADEVEKPIEPNIQGQSLRNEFTFLSDAKCLPEFKILVADKITAYHNYIRLHQKLFDCESNDEQYATVKNLVSAYEENRKIFAELQHFKNTGKVLGKHPIFSRYARFQSLKGKKVTELVKRRDNLKEAIWRINSEIKKGDKPHLLNDRLESIKEKELELAEIDRLLDNQ